MSFRRSSLGAGAAASLSLALLACTHGSPPTPITDTQLLGKVVPASTLEEGYEGYTLYCRACHGDKGDGNGPSAPGLRPPPRDFTRATFKFGWVVDGLPRDEDLLRIVEGGLHGTAMLEWDVPRSELTDILQYVKTFAAEDWKDADALGERVVPTPDPWGPSRARQAVERGKKIYHGLATCQSCHPAYATQEEIHQASSEVGNKPITSFRDNMFHGELKESEFTVGGKKIKIMPPDFTFNRVRGVRKGSELADLYSTIGAGIPGTAMPAWKGSLPEEDLWALAYYVKSLMDVRDTPEAAALRRRLKGAPPLALPEQASAAQQTGA